MPETSQPLATNTTSTQLSVSNITNCVSVKLTTENFLIWKHQMKNILKMLGLLKFIDPTSQAPPETSSTYDEWTRLDGYVSVCINATIDASLAHLAVDATSAAHLWKLLEETYLQIGFAKKSYLKTQFQTIKQGTSSVQSYCDSIKRIADSLNVVGETVSDSNIVLQTLHGLNVTYNAFVLSIETSGTQPTFTQLRSHLLIYEEPMNQQTESSLSLTAMTALSIDDTKLPHNTNGNSNQSKYTVVCQICRKMGHEASKCYFRFNNSSYRGRGHGRGDSGGRTWQQSNNGRGTHSFGRPGNGPSFNQNPNAHCAEQMNGPVCSNLDVNQSLNSFCAGTTHGIGSYSPTGFGTEHTHDPRLSNQASLTATFQTNTQQCSLMNDFNPGHTTGHIQNSLESGFGPAHFANWAQVQQNPFGSQNDRNRVPTPYFALNTSLLQSSFSDICETVDSWLPDSGATTHMTSDSNLVHGAQPYTGSDKVIIGNDHHRSNSSPHSG